jgi:hypothetical protein
MAEQSSVPGLVDLLGRVTGAGDAGHDAVMSLFAPEIAWESSSRQAVAAGHRAIPVGVCRAVAERMVSTIRPREAGHLSEP